MAPRVLPRGLGNPRKTMRRVLLAAPAALLLTVALAVVLSSRRAQNHATQASASAGRLIFTLKTLDVSSRADQGPGFELVASGENHTSGAFLSGAMYLAGPSGLTVLGPDGASRRKLRSGVELPVAPIEAIAVARLRGTGEPQIMLATAGAGLLVLGPGVESDATPAMHQMLPADADARDLTALLPLSGGDLLLGTRHRGVLIYNGETLTPLRFTLPGIDPASLEVTAMAAVDLIANALQLIARSTPGESIEQEPWFHDASAAMAQEAPAPALHMVLNLDRIAYDPHFRSYWIQRNITWTRQFRAAAADLYIEPSRFREERVLLPKSPQAESAPAVNLAALAAIAPASTGFTRALATRDPSEAVSAIEEKLLGAYNAPPPDPEYAPVPSLESPQTGSDEELEARIDTPPPVSPSASTADLARLFDSASLDAVLTLSSAHNPPEPDGLWVPIRSAVVLHTSLPADPQTLAAALRQTLRGSLTAADIGANFEPREQAGVAIYALTGPRPLFFAVSSTPAAGNLALLADDQAMLLELLHNLSIHSADKAPAGATLIAVFNHSSQRAPYSRLTSLIDGTNAKPGDAQKTGVPALNPDTGARAQPAFFSQNIGSLSDTFANLESESVIESSVDSHLRQTVVYTTATSAQAF